MNAETKKPNTDHVTDTVKNVRRQLKAAGFLMGDARRGHDWTEGVYVRRLGCSRVLSIGYQRTDRSAESLARAVAAPAKIRETLERLGYDVTDRMEIWCTAAI